jgi:4'-phosphopantetheinyl transferase
VHAWHLDLEGMSDMIPRFSNLLDEFEQSRADKYARPKDKQQFVVVRGALRMLLGKYLNVAPERLSFDTSFYGRPFVKESAGLDFNVSHSGGLAVIALARARVGVDIEQIRRISDEKALARRFFSVSEYESLLRFPPHDRLGAFFRCWSRKEAYIKAHGMGLAIPLSSFEVSLEKTIPRIPDHEIGEKEVRRWKFFDLSIPTQYAAALVVEGTVRRITEQPWDYAGFRMQASQISAERTSSLADNP